MKRAVAVCGVSLMMVCLLSGPGARGDVLSQGKSYIYIPSDCTFPWPDTSPPSLLTDGITKYHTETPDGSIAGEVLIQYHGWDICKVVLDLGGLCNITDVKMHLLPGPYYQEVALHYVNVDYSPDNSQWFDFADWTNPVATSSGGWSGGYYDWQTSGTLSGIYGRYVRIALKIYPQDDFNRYVNVDEIQVLGTVVPAALQGTVVLQGYLGDNATAGVRFDLAPVGGGDNLTRFAQLSSAGTFLIDNIPPGTYDLLVRAYASLGVKLEGVAITGQPTVLDTPIELKGADSNGDNAISFEDFSMLQNNYGQSGVSAANPLAAALAGTSGGCGALGIVLLACMALALQGLGWRNDG